MDVVNGRQLLYNNPKDFLTHGSVFNIFYAAHSKNAAHQYFQVNIPPPAAGLRGGLMNNKQKKHVSCAVAAALALTCAAPVVPASAASYSDTNRTNYAEAVSALSDAGIINGYPDGTFRPENSISRAEISKMLSAVILNGYNEEEAAKADEATVHADIRDSALMTVNGATFKDVDSTNWSAPYIGVSSTCGIVTGYTDNTFRPSKTITYNEITAMAVRACEYDMSKVTGAWPANYVAAAKDLGLYKGMKDFDPSTDGSKHVTRGNAAIIINNAASLIETAATDGYKAARTSVPEENADDQQGAQNGQNTGSENSNDLASTVLKTKELSLEDAITIMQTTGLQAETAEMNKKNDQATLRSTSDNLKVINDTLKYADFMDLNTLYQLQSNGVNSTNQKIVRRTREFIEENIDNNYQAEMNSIEKTTRQLYYGVLQAQENVDVSKKSVEIEKQLLEIAKKKHSLGMLSDLALTQQEYSVTSAENTLVQAEQTLLSAQSSFNMLMNLPTDTQLKLTTPLEQAEAELPTLDEAIDSMMNNNLSLKYIDYGIEVAEMQYTSLRYTVSTSSGTYKKAEVSYQNAKIGFEQAKASMKTDMRTNYYNLAELENQIRTFESTISLTEKSLAVQEKQFELGMITISDVNKTKLSLQQAKQGLTNAIVTYNNALSDFNLSMGVGTERITFSAS